MGLIELIGWPVRELLVALHSTGLGWAWVILIACVGLRLAMLPVAYARTRTTRTMAIIGIRRGVELHRQHAEDPDAYRSAFGALYSNNRVMPLTTGVWYLAQIALFLLVATALGSLYGRFGASQLLGAPLTSRGLDSAVGIALTSAEGLLLATLLWRARHGYQMAAWYLRLGGALVIVASTVMVGLLIALPILIYLVTAMAFSFIDDRAVIAMAVWRHGPGGWPVYDERGDVIARGLDAPAGSASQAHRGLFARPRHRG